MYSVSQPFLNGQLHLITQKSSLYFFLKQIKCGHFLDLKDEYRLSLVLMDSKVKILELQSKTVFHSPKQLK